MIPFKPGAWWHEPEPQAREICARRLHVEMAVYVRNDVLVCEQLGLGVWPV